MTIAAAVKKFLDGHGITYHVANHARTRTLEEAAMMLGIQQSQIARSVLLQDDEGIVMAVLPVTHRLDVTRLQKIMQRQLHVVYGRDADKLFSDCEPGSRPPVPEAYGMSCVVDSSLMTTEDIYFEPGTHHAIVHVANHDFKDLLSQAIQADFAYEAKNSAVALAGPQPSAKLGVEIMQRAHACHISQLPEVPLLTALLQGLEEGITPQVFANMLTLPELEDFLLAYYNEILATDGEKIESICALSNGHDQLPLLINLAIAFMIADTLRVHVRGPFANQIIWQQSLGSATAVHYLLEKQAVETIDRPLAFLAALMQKVGVLLLGKLFLPEYRLLNRLAMANPGASLTTMEKRMLGMGQAHDIMSLGHARLGAWLLGNWGFSENIALVAEQHNDWQEESDSPYLQIIQLANLIEAESIAAAPPVGNQQQLCQALGIRAATCDFAVEQLFNQQLRLEQLTQFRGS